VYHVVTGAGIVTSQARSRSVFDLLVMLLYLLANIPVRNDFNFNLQLTDILLVIKQEKMSTPSADMMCGHP